MTKMKTAIAMMSTALLVAGCVPLEDTEEVIAPITEEEISAPEPVEEEPDPEPTEEVKPPPPAPAVKEGEYGSDPYLDRLYDDCEAGDVDACEDLYWDSPIDSEYETYAMGKTADNGIPLDDDLIPLMFEITWDSQTLSDQQDMCFGYIVDPEMMYDAFISGWVDTVAPTYNQFTEFFDSVC